MKRCLRPVWCVLSVCVLCLPVEAGAQALIISEFRVRGPNGANDEFIEIYNASGTNHTVAASSGTGYGVAASDGVIRCSILNGTVIPSRGHFLCVNSVAYSLASYPAGNSTTATGDATYTTDILDNAGIAIFNNNVLVNFTPANRLDAVGPTSEANTLYKEGSGYPTLVPISIDYAFARKVPGVCTGSSVGTTCASVPLIQTTPGATTANLQDTNNNASDFIFANPQANSAGAGQRLGAPGPQNLSSPTATDGVALAVSRLDSCKVNDAPPNHVRSFTADADNNSTFGTIDIRRTFTNTTGGNITRLRFRIVDITTYPPISGVADLRARTSSDVAVTVDRPPCNTGTSAPTVRGTTLEQPPSQAYGSGYGGTLSVGAITVATPLGSGASVDVRFLMGIQQTGAARFCVAAETLPAVSSQIFCFIGPTDGMIRHTSRTFSNSTAIVIPATETGVGTGAPATPYPSNIAVAGITNQVTKVTVTLKQMNHTFASDVEVLLVGPTGVKFILMSDVIGGTDFAGQTYTFDDGASAVMPSGGTPPVSGSFKPTNYGGGDLFPAPAPAGPYLTPGTAGTDMLAAFAGLDPNGTWSLYVVDDANQDIGTIAGGWDLTIRSSCTAPLGAVTSDFNGDCASDVAVYRPSTRTWFVPNQAPDQFGLPGDSAVAGDYNGDGTADRAVYRPTTGEWFVQGQADVQFGLPGDIPVPRDYNGDGTTDRAVFRPSTGQWFVHNQLTAVQWGLPGDIPVPADYNGDLTADLAVYRGSTGTWFVQGQGTLPLGLPGDIPVPGDYNGGADTEPAVYRPSTGTWFVRGQPSVQWGLPGDSPAPLDHDGDLKMDLAVYRPSTGTWYIKLSTTNYVSSVTIQFGLPGDMPIPNSTVTYVLARSTLATLARASDFDADRLSDLTVFRPSNATWFTLRSTSDFVTSASVQWGLSGDVPMPHDYDGDGPTDFAVYRPSTGGWHFLRSSSGYTTSSTISWGLSGDVPLPGDYDGDSVTDPAVYRPSTGQWLILFSSAGYTTTAVHQWGLSGDVPLPGDFDGDARNDLTVYRPSTGTWFTRYSSTGYVTSASHQWGLSGDVAVPGEYDGDGKTDHAVYRPSTGGWFILHSSSNQTTSANYQWGLSSDTPVPGDFDGDRKTDLAVWRPSTGTWYLLLSSTNFSVFDQVQWGLSSDIPILKRP